MQEQFVKYNQALALKELGFDMPCIATYTEGTIGKGEELQWFVSPQEDVNNDFTFVAAPLKSQVFEWFREKHGLNHMIDMNFRTNNYITQLWKGRECFFDEHSIKTYEEAESACIDKLIEIVKNNLDK